MVGNLVAFEYVAALSSMVFLSWSLSPESCYYWKIIIMTSAALTLQWRVSTPSAQEVMMHWNLFINSSPPRVQVQVQTCSSIPASSSSSSSSSSQNPSSNSSSSNIPSSQSQKFNLHSVQCTTCASQGKTAESHAAKNQTAGEQIKVKEAQTHSLKQLLNYCKWTFEVAALCSPETGLSKP